MVPGPYLVPLGVSPMKADGDLGYVDAQGCFFTVERIERMIDMSYDAVWSAAGVMLRYRHPAADEVAVISTPPVSAQRRHVARSSP